MSITTAQITWRFNQIYSEDIFTFYIAHKGSNLMTKVSVSTWCDFV